MRFVAFVFVVMSYVAVSSAAEVDYQRDIQPMLAEKCATCHGALKQNAGLRLDAGVLIRKGSDDGPVVVLGDAAESPMIKRVINEDESERMPPEGEGERLTPEQVAILSAWINSGAPFPENEAVPADPRQHWAYQAPERPSVPDVGDSRWSHPIDAFIARGHQRQGLTAVELADPYTLLRRLYMDLIGLPPTRGQIELFMSDNSDDAWRNVVDQLLESPQYGERWGRHWMDVWRYSDWDGYKKELRGSQRHIWRWRDWIVQSLCEDKGYDQMIVEMLAADEVAPNDARALPATGFLARNFHKSNRNIWLDATVEHTAKAFLGMTLNCARCHDHKYDPLPQTAYYQFRAIFEPHKVRTDQIPGQPDTMKDGVPRAFDEDLKAQTFLYLRGNEKHPDKEHPITPNVPAVIGGQFDIQAVDLPVEAYYPALRETIVNDQLAKAESQLATASKQREQDQSKIAQLNHKVAELRIESLNARRAADHAKFAAAESSTAEEKQLAKVAAEAERRLGAAQAELTFEQKKGALQAAESKKEDDEKKKTAAVAATKKQLTDAEKKLKAARDALSKSDGTYTPLGKTYPRTSSGRRLALARWIASQDNPLTARVAVNQIWMRHFDTPLVDNVFDFGLRSPRPRHAELLDWLAVELMENDWSMKHLHRLIVTSRTWRLDSTVGRVANPSDKIDHDNHFLWRMNARRLDAEIVRDNVLAVSGQLDKTMGGADIDFRQGETSRRRSIYLRHAYEKQMTMLVVFDAASPNECYRRSESIVPQQALALSNSSMSLGQSRLLARRLSDECKEEGEFVQAAFLQVLSRPPNEDELNACREFLSEQSTTLTDTTKLTTFAGGSAPKVKPATDPKIRARENLVHVLMNHNDFVTIR